MVISPTAVLTEAHFKEAVAVATSYLKNLNFNLHYHCQEHTLRYVLPAAVAIAAGERFSAEETYIVEIAAVFHDTGFCEQYNANEAVGVRYAEEYMKSSALPYTEEQIALVRETILNTNREIPPPSKYAEVLRDADVAILGDVDFFTWNKALREESQIHPESQLHSSSVDDARWTELQLHFFSSVDWFTVTARKLYQPGKEKNFARLQKISTP